MKIPLSAVLLFRNTDTASSYPVLISGASGQKVATALHNPSTSRSEFKLTFEEYLKKGKDLTEGFQPSARFVIVEIEVPDDHLLTEPEATALREQIGKLQVANDENLKTIFMLTSSKGELEALLRSKADTIQDLEHSLESAIARAKELEDAGKDVAGELENSENKLKVALEQLELSNTKIKTLEADLDTAAALMQEASKQGGDPTEALSNLADLAAAVAPNDPDVMQSAGQPPENGASVMQPAVQEAPPPSDDAPKPAVHRYTQEELDAIDNYRKLLSIAKEVAGKDIEAHSKKDCIAIILKAQQPPE